MRIITSLFLFITTSIQCFTLEVKSQAPDFIEIDSWINSEPLHIENLRGHVVVIDFWDYSCINCIRTLPHLISLYKNYKDKGLVVIGVHTPEFVFEQDLNNVRAAVRRYGIAYPVPLDNQYKTWRAYENHFWPTTYVIDQEGRTTFSHIGEGNYIELENACRKLLKLPALAEKNQPRDMRPISPEIYLGSRRASNYTSEIQLLTDAVHPYSFKKPLAKDTVGIKGLWRVSGESITSAGSDCSIELNFTAGLIHIVLSGSSQDPITLLLDGKPVSPEYYTADMDSDGQIFLDGERMYYLLDLHGDVSHHQLTMNLPPGISAYTITFGR